MTDQFNIRIAAAQDADPISELLKQTYSVLLASDYEADELAAALPVISTARPELLASGTYFVAENNKQQIIGAGGWSFGNPERGGKSTNTAHIRHVGVAPTAVRQGVGSKIMQALFAQSKAFGVRNYACLSTYTAESFYQSFGFRKVENRRIQLAGGIPFPVTYMSL